MRALKTPLIVSTFAALAALSAPAPAQTMLSMADIKTLITGNTIDIQRQSDGARFRNYYVATGDVILQRSDAVEFSGRWSVRADGTLCVFFDVEACGSTEKNADGTYTRSIDGKPAFRWLKVTPGKDF